MIIVLIMQSLTGGVLLLRNKFYIILYRGNDFLPSGVANSVAERELELKRCQLFEEQARLKASESVPAVHKPSPCSSTTGTLSDFLDMQADNCDIQKGISDVIKVKAGIERLKKELRKQERKLYIVYCEVTILYLVFWGLICQ